MPKSKRSLTPEEAARVEALINVHEFISKIAITIERDHLGTGKAHNCFGCAGTYGSQGGCLGSYGTYGCTGDLKPKDR